jgi:inositol transport system substrate-binding protein
LIIVQPNDGESQRPFVERAIEAGILVITTNAKIPDIEGGSSVDADPFNQGAVLAMAAAELVPDGGNVVILSCLPGNLHTTSRYQAFQELFIDVRPDVNIIASHTFNEVDPAGAMAFIEDIMQSVGQIDAVLTVADVLALAAVEAVRDNPLYDDMLVWGVDGLAGALLSIRDGGQTGTCLQNAVELADKNMRAAYLLLTGAETVVHDSIGEVYIDISNVEEWIEAFVEYGLLSPEEAGQ